MLFQSEWLHIFVNQVNFELLIWIILEYSIIIVDLITLIFTTMGRNKRAIPGQFHKGHEGYRRIPEYGIVEKKTTKRFDEDTFSRVVKTSPSGNIYAPDAEGQPGPATLLRPRKAKSDRDASREYAEGNLGADTEMRLVNTTKCSKMWNETIVDHGATECRLPNFEVDREVKKGLGWKQGLKCLNCGYASPMFKLYEEVQSAGRGPKSAACNVRLQIALQDTPIGNTRARMLIACTNTPPPALSGMNRLATRVSSSVEQLNKRDMRDRARQMKQTNQLRGLSAEEPVNISLDVRYNSTTITSRNKMGQSATQAIGVAIENQTDKKQIISCQMLNKLCPVGSWLRNRGFNAQCPAHEDCSANLSDPDPISEREIGSMIGEELANNGLFVRHVTTDGDARGAEGVGLAMRKRDPDWQLERQADTTHLGQGQFRSAMRATFSSTMFPGVTAERRKEQQKVFSLDIKNRCHCILADLHRKYAGNIQVIARKMPKILETTVACYGGDCTGCRRNGIVCGGGKRKNWWARSHYLGSNGIKHLNVQEGDEDIIRALLLLRLGVESLRLTRFNTNTNKNEAINRGLSVSLPKNVNFSRNAPGRMHSAIHRMNHGEGNSLVHKTEHLGCPLSQGGRVARAVRQLQLNNTYHRSYIRQSLTRRRMLNNKLRRMKAFLTAKYRKRIRPDYQKGQLDPSIPSTSRAARKMHVYDLRRRPGRVTEHDEHTYYKPLHYI